MTVFRAFFKVIIKNIQVILIYLVIFLVIALMFGVGDDSVSSDSNQKYYSQKAKIAVIDKDNSRLSKEFTSAITAENEVVKVKDKDKKKLDAVFYQSVDAIVTIPKGFGKTLNDGKKANIERVKTPASYNRFYVDQLINRYITVYQYYRNADKDASVDEILKKVNNKLSIGIRPEVTGEKEKNQTASITTILNFSAYSILVIMITLECIVFNVFYDSNMDKRLNVSSKKGWKMIVIQMISNLMMAIGVVSLNYLILLLIRPNEMISIQGVLYAANMLVLAILGVAIGILCAIFIKTIQGQTTAANIIALLSCFLCGVLAPEGGLGEGANQMASLTPVYYFVKANKEIASMKIINSTVLTDISIALGIQILFTISVTAVILLVTKYRAN